MGKIFRNRPRRVQVWRIFPLPEKNTEERKQVWGYFLYPAARVNHSHRRAFIIITAQVEECLRDSGVKEVLLLCNAKSSQLNNLYRFW